MNCNCQSCSGCGPEPDPLAEEIEELCADQCDNEGCNVDWQKCVDELLREDGNTEKWTKLCADCPALERLKQATRPKPKGAKMPDNNDKPECRKCGEPEIHPKHKGDE